MTRQEMMEQAVSRLCEVLGWEPMPDDEFLCVALYVRYDDMLTHLAYGITDISASVSVQIGRWRVTSVFCLPDTTTVTISKGELHVCDGDEDEFNAVLDDLRESGIFQRFAEENTQ